jgi:predicted site-specific integrase-resolvase
MNQTLTSSLWKPEQAASNINISTKTLREYVVAGLIPCIKLSAKCHRFDPAQVRAAMSKLTTGV